MRPCPAENTACILCISIDVVAGDGGKGGVVKEGRDIFLPFGLVFCFRCRFAIEEFDD